MSLSRRSTVTVHLPSDGKLNLQVVVSGSPSTTPVPAALAGAVGAYVEPDSSVNIHLTWNCLSLGSTGFLSRSPGSSTAIENSCSMPSGNLAGFAVPPTVAPFSLTS